MATSLLMGHILSANSYQSVKTGIIFSGHISSIPGIIITISLLNNSSNNLESGYSP